MENLKLEFECQTTTANKQQTSFQFVIPAPAPLKGQAPTQAKTVAQITFTDASEAPDIKPGDKITFVLSKV